MKKGVHFTRKIGQRVHQQGGFRPEGTWLRAPKWGEAKNRPKIGQRVHHQGVLRSEKEFFGQRVYEYGHSKWEEAKNRPKVASARSFSTRGTSIRGLRGPIARVRTRKARTLCFLPFRKGNENVICIRHAYAPPKVGWRISATAPCAYGGGKPIARSGTLLPVLPP